VSRDVTIGDASPRELQATDTAPLPRTDAAEKIADLVDGDPVERRRAALALGEGRPTEASLDALIEYGLADDDADVRQFAVEALGELGGERAGEAAVAACDDPDPWVRAEEPSSRSTGSAGASTRRPSRRRSTTTTTRSSGTRWSRCSSCAARRCAPSCWSCRTRTASASESGRSTCSPASTTSAPHPASTRSRTTRRSRKSSGAPPSVRALDADPGKFRRQFSGGTENDSADLPGESTLNRRPDL